MSTFDYPLVYPDLRKSETEPSGGYVEMHSTHASRLRQHIHRAVNVKQVWLIFKDNLYRFSPAEIRSKHIEDKIP